MSQSVSQKCKDAIVDQFRERTGQRPSIDKAHPDLRINIHIDRDQVSVALDTSGNSLHQRGYRTATNIAPINEVLAAGVLLLSGWDGETDFLDPMCGSGTVCKMAMLNNRNFIGMDISEKYVELSKERIQMHHDEIKFG